MLYAHSAWLFSNPSMVFHSPSPTFHLYGVFRELHIATEWQATYITFQHSLQPVIGKRVESGTITFDRWG